MLPYLEYGSIIPIYHKMTYIYITYEEIFTQILLNLCDNEIFCSII